MLQIFPRRVPQPLQHADGPHRPADVIEQHPVGDGDPAVAAGVPAADGEIAERHCERVEGGYLVRLVYTVAETFNF